MPLAHPNIDWPGGDNPRAPADLVDPTTRAVLILHNGHVTPLPMQPAGALVPDPAVGYATSG